ncbi:MAG: epoxide hydrolase family protein, partial [Candidatus Binataceae bacterium]
MAQAGLEAFTVAVPERVITDLRDRLTRTRFPDELPDTGWDYGANLAYLKELIDYWRTKYDWRKHEAEINRFKQFRAQVDGLGIHFIHEQGRGPNPKPLLLLHGWPGSIYEFMQIIPQLTDPGSHGRDVRESFTVVAPSLVGYGFSDHGETRAMNIQAQA